MIELSKHIQYLLLENDCVIVPDLGGFIAHYRPAHYDEQDGVYVPPVRTIGFNPQLTMNDGLLVQSFMQTHHTDLPDATRMIAAKVDRIKDILYHEGMVEFQGVGNLYFNIHNDYEFQPLEQGILSPTLYGLGTLQLPCLSEKPILLNDHSVVETREIPEAQSVTSQTPRKVFTLIPGVWARNAVAVVAAILLSFLLAVPVENTYIDEGDYASLGSDRLFEEIREYSMVTTLFKGDTDQDIKKKKHSLKPVSVRTVKVGKASTAQDDKSAAKPKAEEKKATVSLPTVTAQNKPAAATPAEVKKAEAPVVKQPTRQEAKAPVAKETAVKPEKTYHIIVSSLDNAADAQQILKDYKQKGYRNATIIEGNGRYRVSLDHFTQKAEAYKQMNTLKKDSTFKSAWMLTVR